MPIRRFLNAKIHRATITDSSLNYVGSITIDRALMAAADLMVHEQVAVFDLDNGARFETYVIEGEQGEIIVNGAAARLVAPGDKVIIVSYVDLTEQEQQRHSPRIVFVDEENRQTIAERSA